MLGFSQILPDEAYFVWKNKQVIGSHNDAVELFFKQTFFA